LHPMAQHLISSDLENLISSDLNLSSTPELAHLRAQLELTRVPSKLGTPPLIRMPSKSSLTSSLNAHLAGLSGGAAHLDALAPASDTASAFDQSTSSFAYGVPSSLLPNVGRSTSFAAGLPSSVMRDASLGAQVLLDCA
jgi:hypothetical protein